MRKAFRILALGLTVAALGLWLGTGAHRGWTQTTVTVVEVDPVTGLENPVPHRKFVLGVEWLGAGLAAALALAGGSFLFPSKQQKPNHSSP